MTRETKYVLTWGDEDSPGICWYIRGIRPGGRFYGSVHHVFANDDPRRAEFEGIVDAGGCGTSVEGVVPPDDWARCTEILDELASGGPPKPGPCFAFLGRWGDGRDLWNAESVFRYDPGDEQQSAAARLFLELKEILDRQIASYYPSIKWP